MPYKQEEILEKYNKMEEAGRTACENGTIVPFAGFSPALSNRANFSFIASDETALTVAERITGPLSAVADSLGISLLWAGFHYPVHITLQEAVLEKPDVVLDALELFKSVSGRIDQIWGFLGASFNMERLIMDGSGNVVLVAEQFDDCISSDRYTLTKVFAEQGLKPLAMHNILHSTTTRIIALPENDAASNVRIFQMKVEQLRTEIRKSPIEFCVGEIYTGNTFDLLAKKPGK